MMILTPEFISFLPQSQLLTNGIEVCGFFKSNLEVRIFIFKTIFEFKHSVTLKRDQRPLEGFTTPVSVKCSIISLLPKNEIF